MINNNNLLGDINNDEIINVIDVVLLVNIVLDESNNLLGDLNNDSLINILDIILLVNIIIIL